MNAKAARLLAAADGLPDDAVVVEIGCARFATEFESDGWSTVYLAHAAAEHGWDFHSVDVDAGAVANASRLTAGLPVTFHIGDGAAFLAGLEPPVDLLYLDGGLDGAADQYQATTLAPGAVVVVDDVQQIGDLKDGKATGLLPLLSDDGWTVEVFDTARGYRMAVATR